MLKHEVENSSIVIERLSKSIAPAIHKMTGFIKSEEAYHVVSSKQLKIIERSMDTISEEAKKLSLLMDQLIAEYEGNKNAK